MFGLRASLTPWGPAPRRNDFVRAGLSLIVLAILLFGGEMAVKWHRGRFAYQRAYAARADDFRHDAQLNHIALGLYEPHVASSHSCSICRQWHPPANELFKRVLRKWLENERNSQWCRRMAESPFRATYNRTAKDL